MAQPPKGNFQEDRKGTYPGVNALLNGEEGTYPGVNALLNGEKGNKQLCHSLNLTQINSLQSTTLSSKATN